MGNMSRNLKVWLLDPAAFTLFYERPLLHALTAQGVDVRLFTSRNIYDARATQDSGSEIYFYFRLLEKFPRLNQFGKVRRITRGLHYLVDQWQLIRQIQQQKPHIVHVQWTLLPLIDRWTWQQARLQGSKILFTGHDLVPNHLSFAFAKRYFGLYRYADGVILHSEQNRESFLKWGNLLYPDEDWNARVRVIPMGIPDHHADIPQDFARQTLQIAPDVPLILFLGNIRTYKGVPVLLAAFRQVLEQMPNAHLLIAGMVTNDFGVGEIEQMAHGIPNVRLELKFIPYDLAPTYYAAADITVLPYLYITQSAVALSALSQGCPMVASDVGGLSDIVIEGETGLLVPPNEVNALAESILKLLQAPDLRRTMSLNARRLAHEKFSWEAIATRTKAVYEELLR